MFEWIHQVPDIIHHAFAVKQAVHIGSFSIVPNGGEYIIYHLNDVTNQLQLVGNEHTIKEAVKTVHEIKINFR